MAHLGLHYICTTSCAHDQQHVLPKLGLHMVGEFLRPLQKYKYQSIDTTMMHSGKAGVRSFNTLRNLLGEHFCYKREAKRGPVLPEYFSTRRPKAIILYRLTQDSVKTSRRPRRMLKGQATRRAKLGPKPSRTVNLPKIPWIFLSLFASCHVYSQ